MTAVCSSEESRLRWRCRRGMLELDLLLNSFLDRQGGRLSAEQARHFDVLLDYPDQVLLDLVMAKTQSADPELSALLEAIRLAANQQDTEQG